MGITESIHHLRKECVCQVVQLLTVGILLVRLGVCGSKGWHLLFRKHHAGQMGKCWNRKQTRLLSEYRVPKLMIW